MPRSSDADLREVVAALARPLAAALDLEVLEVVVNGAQGSRVVRIVVDTVATDPEAGVGIDEIARLTRELDEAIDREDPIPGAYTLEITSPGADRPLTRARDFARNRGRRVRVELAAEAGEELTGELVEVTGSTLTIATDDGDRELPLDAVVRGHVVLPW
ncbi:MAG: ribosome maturation factor RimP [Nitriliruptoraceae bacterium]